MDDQPGSPLVVRCSSCHTVYEQAESEDEPAGCPKCAETVWIAAEIPLPSPAPSGAT